MIFKSMYSQLKSCVKVKNDLKQFFKCYIGTRQGCVSSPIIFSLFINDSISYLKSECNRGIFVSKFCLSVGMHLNLLKTKL